MRRRISTVPSQHLRQVLRWRVREEIVITTKLSNVSRDVLTLFDTNRDCDYEVEARFEGGESATRTEYFRQLKCGGGKLEDGRRKLLALKPNASAEDEIVFNRFYELSRSGQYSIVVSRKVPKEIWESPIRSNTLVLNRRD